MEVSLDELMMRGDGGWLGGWWSVTESNAILGAIKQCHQIYEDAVESWILILSLRR